MKRDRKNRIREFAGDVQTNEPFSRHFLFSPPTLAWARRHIANWVKKQAGGIAYSIDESARCKAVSHTPPQVDISTYRNTIWRTLRTVAESSQRQKAAAPLLYFLHIGDAPTRHEDVDLSPVFIAENSKAGDTYPEQLVRQYPLFSRSSSLNLARFPKFPCFRKRRISGEGYASCQCPLRTMDVQTYVCSVGMLRETSDHSGTMDQRLLRMLSRSISERDQKQDGDQPPPEKPKPGKSKTEKPEIEVDKGAQRVKRPKKRIGMPPPPDKRGRSALVLTLRGFCWPLFFLL